MPAPLSKPEAWLSWVVGMTCGLWVYPVVAFFGGSLDPHVAFVFGLGYLIVGILWYLWQRRGYYMAELGGGADV